VSAPQSAGGRARQAQIKAVLGESGYRRYQQTLGRAGGEVRQAQLRTSLGEAGYCDRQRTLYLRAVEKHGVEKMRKVLTRTCERRRCWRIANPTPGESLLHWLALEAGFTLHADLSGRWEWSRWHSDLDSWSFTTSDALIEARVLGYACDLLLPAHALAIEVHGGVHALTAERDAARTAALNAQGITVITLSNAQVFAGEAEQLFAELLTLLANPT
jgi:hypothetical protein